MSNTIAKHVEDILTALGEDPNRAGLKGTPKRYEKALEHLTKGYRENLQSIIKKSVFQSRMDEMVILKNIELYSLCEHHILPFIGRCHVAYLPNGKIIGLSKIACILDMFAKRLQVQENLTKQVAEAILTATDAKGVGVIIEAKHLCMMMRGIRKQNSEMITSVMLGTLREDSRTRSEFLSLIRK